ncbi:MAG: prephenate dehydrogenase/arogenate dehydrogenase family protein [Abditibacteriales bacterium]|nr:prephenate dehydrogenase/arogenate dehydrogenase family protein [Abditibacteriales bacterium]MDW8367562.1 prephenate dehydrogenase/arogenate dehydrogenase family protein [Abditibacteriales bacterium]
MLIADTVAVIGIGLIGGSYGLALKARGLARCVIGVARRETTRHIARSVGAADETTDDAREAVREADLVILCTPVGSIADMAQHIAPTLQRDCVVTDAGSTKVGIVRDCEAILGRRFVGGHPMAGSHETGPQWARADLFVGATYVLTPTPQTDPAALETVRTLAEKLGARPLLLDALTHDELVAFTSHLPHVVAFALANAVAAKQKENPHAAQLAASGFRDMTRLAASDPQLWTDICLANRDAVLTAIAEFERQLRALKSALVDEDATGFTAALRAAVEGRASMLEHGSLGK